APRRPVVRAHAALVFRERVLHFAAGMSHDGHRSGQTVRNPRTRSPAMRKVTALALLLAVAVGLAACGGDDDDSSSATSTSAASTTSCSLKPVTPDTLTVVTSLPGPGFWEGSDTDPTKLKSGFEYDIAKTIQQKCGLSKFVVRNVGFDAIVAGTVK